MRQEKRCGLRLRSVFQYLRECGMDVNHIREFVDGGILAHQNTDLLDDVGSMGTIGMTTEDLSVGRSHEELQKTFALVHGKSLAIGTPEGLLADKVDALCLELILSRTNACSLGGGEDGCRHDIETDTIALAEDMIDSADGLHLSGMGKHLTTIDITDGIDALNGSRIVFIYRDTLTLIVFEAGIGKICLHSRFATCSYEDNVGIDISDILNGGLHLEGDATLLKVLTQALGDVAVEGRETFLQELDNGNLRAKATEDRGKLHADDTCTDDAEALGESVEIQQACGVDNARVIEAGNRDLLGLRTCGDDDVLGGIVAHRIGIDKDTFLSNQCDVRMREDALNACTELGNDLRHALTSLSEGG